MVSRGYFQSTLWREHKECALTRHPDEFFSMGWAMMSLGWHVLEGRPDDGDLHARAEQAPERGCQPA